MGMRGGQVRVLGAMGGGGATCRGWYLLMQRGGAVLTAPGDLAGSFQGLVQESWGSG